MRTNSTFSSIGYLASGLLIICSLVFLAYMVSAAKLYAQADDVSVSTSTDSPTPAYYDQPNILASTVGMIGSDVRDGTASARRTAGSVLRTGGQAAVTTARFAATATYTVIDTMANSIYRGLSFAVRTTGRFFGGIFASPIVDAAVKPTRRADVPVIDQQVISEFMLEQHLAALPVESAPDSSADTAVWPVHGRVTTLFGVPHWPYQPTHTGIDISDGSGPGITPVKPFRPGTVIDTVTTSKGLGNHVVVDHGDGLTSVYAHLHTISVQKGQAVGYDTILGLVGSTGASTGAHLHFEIRLNGQPVNPYLYVVGQP